MEVKITHMASRLDQCMKKTVAPPAQMIKKKTLQNT